MNKELRQIIDKIEQGLQYRPVKLHRCYWDRNRRRYIYIRKREIPVWYTDLVESVKKKTFMESIGHIFEGRGLKRTVARIGSRPTRKSKHR